MNRKAPQDQSPTYLQRQSQAWCKVHKERVRSIIKQKRLCLDAKLIYMGLLTYFHDGGGVLIESKERVAKSLGFTKERLDYSIEKLEQDAWLEVSESGMIFEPVVYKYITGNEHPDDSESSRISQDLAKSGRILQNSPGETSPVEESRKFSGDSSPTKRTVTTQNNNQEKGRESAPLPLPFSGLTEKDLEVIGNEFPNLDFARVYQKFADHHATKGTKAATLAMLRGWFKREKPAKQDAATASPQPSSRSEPVKHEAAKPAAEPEPNESHELPKLEYRNCSLDLQLEGMDSLRKDYGWFIGEKKIAEWGTKNAFVKFCRSMPASSAEECRKYLLKLTKVKDWDTRDALNRFDVLFTETNWDEDGFEPIEWSGVETAENEMEEMRKDEAAIS